MEWERPSTARSSPDPKSDLFSRAGDDTITTAFPGWYRSSEDPWYGYVEGYRLAADAILQRVEETGLDQDSLVFPFLMCWRHHVELQLKSLITLMQRGLRAPVNVPSHHKIDRLWRDTVVLLDQVTAFDEDKAISHAERLILQLHETDPTAQESRYPMTTKGAPTLESIVYFDMRIFHSGMQEVANFLSGTHVGLSEHFKVRRDYG
ncbi:hypothetical protein [Nonomuraea sp. NPDC049028]|uniref:hypothetical protein n=1 Tax=Nonomuraea sp. NPDC049028 TaxID=3364348 RepID=UPI0037187143